MLKSHGHNTSKASYLCDVIAVALGLGAVAFVGCAADPATEDGAGGAAASTAGDGGDGSQATGSGAAGSGGGATTTTGTNGTGDTTGAGGGTGLPDPNLDGEYAYDTLDASVTVDATGDTFDVHAFIPSAGPSSGPYPLVVIAHGFQLPTSEYTLYAERLASFGYVAVLPDYPTSLFSPSHVDNALDLSGVVDWAETAAALAGKVDTSLTGMTGHSLGGKVSLLAAKNDPRVKAVIALDPVDSATSCNATDCPDMSSQMGSLTIPTGFLGETTDASGGFQPCAPAADNFTTFYANAPSPSFMVTVLGANHMSFLDDVAGCGFTCSFCQPSTANDAEVNAMARAYVTAFFERHLRGIAGYDAYLTGSEAEARYVTPGKATIESK
ncbi:MAG TPA: CocE/NonD family hydrolase [Polyangiaceae bacterium]|nr:CocE/NonD family hydrolase [Polyangiaceae bacterium]